MAIECAAPRVPSLTGSSRSGTGAVVGHAVQPDHDLLRAGPDRRRRAGWPSHRVRCSARVGPDPVAGTARCTATSGRRRARRSPSSASRTSRLWNLSEPTCSARASARLPSEPVDRSSTTSTVWPSASSRSTTWEPRNPAPPTTSDLMPGQAGRPWRGVPPPPRPHRDPARRRRAWRPPARRASGPSTESTTTAFSSTRTPDRSTLDRTSAPAADPHPGTENAAVDVAIDLCADAHSGLVHGLPGAAHGVEVGLPVQVWAAGVDPVVVRAQGEQPAFGRHGREHVPLDENDRRPVHARPWTARRRRCRR